MHVNIYSLSLPNYNLEPSKKMFKDFKILYTIYYIGQYEYRRCIHSLRKT